MKALGSLSALAWFIALLAMPAFADQNLPASLRQEKYRIGKIKKITIHSDEAKSFAKEAACTDLKIDERRIRFFLANARPNSQHNFSQALSAGDCSAEGEIILAGGRKAVISLTSAIGWGALRVGKKTYFMDCPACDDILSPDFKFDPNDKSDTH
jgi:hypothetical protein